MPQKKGRDKILRRALKTLFVLAVLFIAARIIYSDSRNYFHEIPKILAESDKYYLPILFFLQLVSYSVAALATKILLEARGVSSKFCDNLKIAVGNEFGNREPGSGRDFHDVLFAET